MTLLARGRTVTARAPGVHVPSSKESEWSVNCSVLIAHYQVGLPTALETSHSRLIWMAGMMAKFRFGLKCL